MVVKTIIIAAGICLLALFLIPSILTGNFHIGALTGGGIGTVLILYGIFIDPVNTFILFLWRRIPGKCLLAVAAAAILAIMVLALMCIVSMASVSGRCRVCSTSADETDSSADPADSDLTVVVLGCHVYSYGPSKLLISRLDTAADYLSSHPASACIVCGGQGSGEPCSEASVMRDYLVNKGISTDRIHMDDTSTDTSENFANAAGIIQKENLNPQVVIVTNDFHMYRSLAIAEKNKLADPEALPAPTLWWLFCPFAVREMYGILEMWFLL